MSNKRLQNKHVLITGASSGIGYALSMLCASEGAKVIGLARNESKLKEIKKRYRI
ncbi:MAG: SDR family NAD(P)-dependent oxidoreductase [Fimbriimonadales bacterium]|nr:SDR family NAD(P)-dependent oxidoreductase [Fimbriimonadales bacterium]